MSVEIIKHGDTIAGIEDGSIKAALELGINVANQAIELAPVDTGQLKGSIGYSWSKGETATPPISQPQDETSVHVGTAVEHGTYQEYGTRYMQAQPWLRPAIDLEARGKSAEDVVKKHQLESMDKATKRGKRSVNL